MTGLEAFAYGLLGGIAVELIEVRRIHARSQKVRKRYFDDRLFWWLRLAFAVLGGCFAIAYNDLGPELNAWLAVTIGAAWPTIFGRATDTLPLPAAHTN
jgi:hypothetical protein